MTSSTSQSQPLSAEEEAIKRNTDCVYFLASPLTCKKGNECDYRHSEVARLNPRDCWYWQTSKCLNPKCAFRHPPLDGLRGNQVAASTGSSSSTPRPVTTAIPLVPNSATVPCVFFKKGHCMKGDWCPFLHAPISSGSKVLPVPVTALAAENAVVKVGSSGMQKRVLDKKVLSASAAKPITAASQEKLTKDVPAPFRNAFSAADINESNGHRPGRPISNGNPVGRPDRAQQLHHMGETEGMNGKDLEEVSREPSPGFDVLVDDEGRDPDYYAGDDRYGMSGEYEARNELDIGHSSDYYMISGVEDERYQDSMNYDPHEQHHLASERNQALNERMSGGPYYDNNPYNRSRTLSHIDDLDLRRRLIKPKKPNSLRSVINHELPYDIQTREVYQDKHRDVRHASFRGNSFGGRLRGRIELPRRSRSPGNTILSGGAEPVGVSSSHTRMRGVIKSGNEESFTYGLRDHTVFHGRRESPLLHSNADFPAPKSLSELKNGKSAYSSEQAQTDLQFGKRKRLTNEEQPGGTGLSFEGPKSLQEILKRKRGEGNGKTSNMASSNDPAITKDTIEARTKFAAVYEQEEKPDASDSTPKTDSSTIHGVDDIPIDDGVEENGEDYDYNQEGEDDLELYEDQNADAVEGKYTDGQDDNANDDDDDFAKKMGVVYS